LFVEVVISGHGGFRIASSFSVSETHVVVVI